MTRIFLTSSHLSSIMAALISEKLSGNGDKNYLIIDHYYKKESLIELIKSTNKIHKWTEIVDFSIHIDNSTDLKPSLKKTVLRKVKNLPFFRTVYQKMLHQHNLKYIANQKREVTDAFKKHQISHCDQLFVLTQTALNDTLTSIFPNAQINYFEHGLGDYYYCWKKELKGEFYGLFGNEFQKFLSKRNTNTIKSFGDFSMEKKESAFNSCFDLINTRLDSLKGKKCGLFLMDALEGYNPPENFWTDYIKKSLLEMKPDKDFILLVKPHPNQSNGVIELTENYLKNNNINFKMLSDSDFISISAEMIFAYLKAEIKCLVSTFSSSVFYLAKLYPGNCDFILMYDFVEQYLQNGPKQYLNHYYGLKPLIEDVFWSDSIRMVK